jgi:tetratricopeptide (TPR) repeat protein
MVVDRPVAGRKADGTLTHLLAAVAIFVVAFAMRWWFLCGLMLGDDPQELNVLQQILVYGPMLTDQLHLRFGTWVANHLAFVLFGVSETTFLAPTWILSSSFGVLAYALLVRWGYGAGRAFLGGLLVASAPFEIVLGTLRANDLYLAWAFTLGFVLLLVLEERPVLQGISVAVCLWFGFYVKLWAVYVLPALGLYYLAGRRWRGAGAFVVASVLIHGATCAYWQAVLGTPVPFLTSYAVNYAVPRNELVDLWLKYPRLIFQGSSEFGTTLFGAIPYLLVLLLVVKAIATWRRVSALVFDRADALLLGFYGTFFVLVEFVPNGFQLDAYYSVPRIFRYLAPVSFPIALHVAKMLLDVARAANASSRAALLLVMPALALNVYQAAEATGPGRIYRQNLIAVLDDVRAAAPPALLAESLLASYFRNLYLDPDRDRIAVIVLIEPHNAPDYERWLHDHESSLPNGTMLVTGLASFVHYGAHIDGFRLRWFEGALSPQWRLVKEYGVLSYLPRPEPARLWRLEREASSVPPDPVEDLSTLAGIDDPDALQKGAMARYERGDYPGARIYFRKILHEHPAEAEDAAFFYAASFVREANWSRSRREFKRFVRRFPQSHWVPTAYWEIAVCDREGGRIAQARAGFIAVIRRFPTDPSTVKLASADLERLRRARGGLVLDIWRRWVSGRS